MQSLLHSWRKCIYLLFFLAFFLYVAIYSERGVLPISTSRADATMCLQNSFSFFLGPLDNHISQSFAIRWYHLLTMEESPITERAISADTMSVLLTWFQCPSGLAGRLFPASLLWAGHVTSSAHVMSSTFKPEPKNFHVTPPIHCALSCRRGWCHTMARGWCHTMARSLSHNVVQSRPTKNIKTGLFIRNKETYILSSHWDFLLYFYFQDLVQLTWLL